MCNCEDFIHILVKKDTTNKYIDKTQLKKYTSEGWKKIKEEYLGGKKQNV